MTWRNSSTENKRDRPGLSHKKSSMFLLALSLMMTILAARTPIAEASGGLVLDGTSNACATSTTNFVSLQVSDCGGDAGLCTTHQGAFCPTGDLVILQILLNNTGTVTRVQATQGLEHWFRRASVLNGIGGR